MFAFQFFNQFLLAVLSHWVALMSGVASIALGFLQTVRKKASPYVLYVVAAMCVFFAAFQAWQDQYRENEASRSSGLFPLTQIVQTRYKYNDPNEGTIQLSLYFSNGAGRLLDYRFDDLDIESQGKKGDSSRFVNRGGYAYPNQPATFLVTEYPMQNLDAPFGATLSYKVTYYVDGTKMFHHTSKRLGITCFQGQPACRYLVLEEHED